MKLLPAVTIVVCVVFTGRPPVPITLDTATPQPNGIVRGEGHVFSTQPSELFFRAVYDKTGQTSDIPVQCGVPDSYGRTWFAVLQLAPGTYTCYAHGTTVDSDGKEITIEGNRIKGIIVK
jgi:hypothetical protein